jgi:hypothetical protein
MARARDESISEAIFSEGQFDAIFHGWGTSRVLALNCSQEGNLKVIADTGITGTLSSKTDENKKVVPHKPGLTPLLSTSIAGCDLMGACLYTAGVCTVNAGKVT